MGVMDSDVKSTVWNPYQLEGSLAARFIYYFPRKTRYRAELRRQPGRTLTPPFGAKKHGHYIRKSRETGGKN